MCTEYSTVCNLIPRSKYLLHIKGDTIFNNKTDNMGIVQLEQYQRIKWVRQCGIFCFLF